MTQEQDPLNLTSRHIANGFSFIRLAYGVKQAIELSETNPSQRTWRDALKTGLVSLTDTADGIVARRYGSTKNGGEIDRLADVSFFGLGDVALSSNREASVIHPVIDLLREVAVNSMRAEAKNAGRPTIKVGMRGRQKTAVKMVALTLARSPLSKHKGLIESTSAFGSALSLLSGAEYAHQYLRGLGTSGAVEQEETDSARNGVARRATESGYTRVARWLNKNAPGIKPDHVTHLGEAMVEGSGLVTLLKPNLGPVLGAVPYTIGGLLDGVDGNLARLQGSESVNGMIKDVSADKRQQIFTAAVNSILAGNKGHSVAAYHYAVAAMTAPLPALFRAIAESKGYIVSEDASGSRVTNSIEGGAGLALNAFRQASDITSALMVVGNVITAGQRADVAMRGNASPHFRGQNNDPEFMKNAEIRRDALLRITAGGLLVGVGLIERERRHSKSVKAASKNAQL